MRGSCILISPENADSYKLDGTLNSFNTTISQIQLLEQVGRIYSDYAPVEGRVLDVSSLFTGLLSGCALDRQLCDCEDEEGC